MLIAIETEDGRYITLKEATQRAVAKALEHGAMALACTASLEMVSASAHGKAAAAFAASAVALKTCSKTVREVDDGWVVVMPMDPGKKPRLEWVGREIVN